MSDRRVGFIKPKLNRKDNTLFLCADCYCSIQKDECNNFYYCNKCNLRLCNNCFIKSNICINGCKKLYTFVKNDDIRVPENLESFHPVISQKYNNWCCYF
jgi:hypothetical protein